MTTYLVRIGPIRSNPSGVGSRGYSVAQVGTTVTVLFGKIEAVGGATTQFRWRYRPRPKNTRCSSSQAAKALAKKLVKDQLKPNAKGSYVMLPKRVRILPGVD